MRPIPFLLGSFLISASLSAQEIQHDLWLWPNPGLPRNASSPLFQDSLSLRPYEVQNPKYLPGTINEKLSKQHLFDLPDRDFQVEFWFLEHGNQPIGLELFLDEKSVAGIWKHQWMFAKQNFPQAKWNKRFTHLVLQKSGTSLLLWENGKLLGKENFNAESQQLRIQSYLENEPYFNLDHWVKHLKIQEKIDSEADIQASYANHQNLVNSGKRMPDRLHFVAEPYLYAPDSQSMSITLELSQLSNLKLAWGSTLPFAPQNSQTAKVEGVHTFHLEGLKSGSSYFYQVSAVDAQGQTVDSGVLTFKTSHSTKDPIVFGVVSDTEARSWVNEQIGQKLWEERVDFVIHMGDITDGGMKDTKWEWTQEFFPGSAALFSRTTHVPVAGNGEGDLFWYNYYHPQALEHGAYRYSNGPGEFYVLNSNDMDQLQPGGAQYEWLKNHLQSSSAAWKFVQMHHAPYSSDEDDYGNTWTSTSTWGDRALQPLLRLLEENGVDVMFFGHLHTYMRTFPLWKDQVDLEKGIHYVQLGGMGGNLEDFAPGRPTFANKQFRGFHYGVVALTERDFTMNVYSAEGHLIDRLELNK